MRHSTDNLHCLIRTIYLYIVLTVIGSNSAFAQPLEDTFSPLTSPEEIFEQQNAESVTPLASSLISQQTTEYPATQEPFSTASCSSSKRCGYQVLPSSLLYHSYIAAPHEPRMSSTVMYDSGANSWRWDSTLGGRVGLVRRYAPPRLDLDAWQLDLEGAVMVRLDPQEQMDLESSDYRFGLQWTGKRGNLTYKFGYFHLSSHVGDEFIVRNPTFARINYVRESLVLGTAWQASPVLRLYGEVAWGMIATGGAEPFQIQYGAEYAKIATNPMHGAPFAAVNLQQRQEVDFAAGLNLMAGWQWKGHESGRAFRVGLQYFNGPSNQYQFYTRFDNQFGLGVWLDY